MTLLKPLYELKSLQIEKMAIYQAEYVTIVQRGKNGMQILNISTVNSMK